MSSRGCIPDGILAETIFALEETVMAQVVRIRPTTYERLKSLSERSGKALIDVLDEAIENLQRKQFLDECNQAYAKLKKNPKKWKQYQDEIAVWDATLQDGLKDE